VFRPLPVLSVFALLALCVLIALGVWQLQRREQKHALLDQIAQRSSSPAEEVEILLATGDYAAFRTAIARGAFDHQREVFVFAPRSDKGPTLQGYKVLTPFHLTSGKTLLVDRGWIAASQKLPRTRAKGQIVGEVSIEGAFRPSSKPGVFVPDPDLKARIFFARDAAAIAKSTGVALSTTLILEAKTRTDGGPEPLSSAIDIPDNHLAYAITWFSLAIVLVVIYLRFHVVKGRLRFGR
jgi:surfeit locus 1 family protein